MNRRNLYCSLVLVCFLLKVAQGQISYQVDFPSMLKITSATLEDKIEYTRVKLPGTVTTDSVGYPALPVRYIKLIIPQEADGLKVEVTNTKTQKFNLSNKIAPKQERITTGFDPLPNFVEPNDKRYSSDDPYPMKLVEIVESGYFRGNHLVTLAIYPCQYFPKMNELDFYTSIEVKLDYNLNMKIKNKDIIRKHTDENRRILEYLVGNTNDINQFSSILDSADIAALDSTEAKVMLKSTVTLSNTKYLDYIIITTDDLEDEFDDFMEWKREKGIKIGLVTLNDIYGSYSSDLISGITDNAGAIREFLKYAYDNGSGIEYALLAGDEVPIRHAYYNTYSSDSNYIIPTDLYFADFNGDWKVDADSRYGEPTHDNVDYNPEIYIGRIMVSNSTEVANWIQKVLKYEQNPGNGSYSYLTRAFYTQADQMQDNDYANDSLEYAITWCPNTTIYEEDGGYNTLTTPSFPTGANVIYRFNYTAFGFACFLAHGAPNRIAVATKGVNDYKKRYVTSFDNSPIASYKEIAETGNSFNDMTNANHPTIYYSTSCTTMPFDDFETEAGDRNMGEVFTGISNGGGPIYNGNTRYGYVGYSEHLLVLFANVITSNTSFNLGKAEASSKQEATCDRYLKLSHNLMGCPETEIWTATPSTFSPTIYYGSNWIYVSTGSVYGSKVCVMSASDDGDSYYEVETITNAEYFEDIPDPEDCTITFTKHNYIPYQVTVGQLKSIGVKTEISELKNLLEKEIVLGQNYPNPFNENTMIDLFIPSESGEAILQVYDLRGKPIQSVIIEERNQTCITLDATNLTPGNYFYSLIIDGKKVATKKMLFQD